MTEIHRWSGVRHAYARRVIDIGWGILCGSEVVLLRAALFRYRHHPQQTIDEEHGLTQLGFEIL